MNSRDANTLYPVFSTRIVEVNNWTFSAPETHEDIRIGNNPLVYEPFGKESPGTSSKLSRLGHRKDSPASEGYDAAKSRADREYRRVVPDELLPS